MKKAEKRVIAALIALAMVFTAFLGYLPSMDVLAAETKTMAHLKSGSGDGNGHFGSGTPEAFILSDDTNITDEDFSFLMKVGSTKEATRFRFVNKYVDDTHWSYIGYDGLHADWFCEYKNGSASSYPGLSNLPVLNQNDVVKVSGTYETDGLHITVENQTTGISGNAVATNSDFLGLKDMKGEIGFGAATYNSDYTDVYFADVVVGSKAYETTSYNYWERYKTTEGQTWEPAVEGVVISEDTEDPDDPDNPTDKGRAWWTITGGSNNSGGHSYGNASAKAPVLLLDNDRRMESGGTLDLVVKPSSNWAVFHTYVDDNNWLYVGWDPTSHWYYQYKLNGSESYPKISGLADPVEGEELQMSISLNRETLSVTVNGVTVRVTNQALIDFAEQTSGKGRFGVKTNGQTSISFADVKYNGTDCMEDEWVFCAERSGQTKEKTYSKVVPLTGTVTDAETSNPLEGAVVRVGVNAATTDKNGHYAFEGLELGSYNMAVTKPGYQAYEDEVKIVDKDENVIDVKLSQKEPLNLENYDSIQSDSMKVYIGKEFPMVARYQMLSGGEEIEDTFFRGNEGDLEAISKVAINGTSIIPEVTVAETTETSQTYNMHVEDVGSSINLDMQVKVSVEENTLTWEVTKLEKADGCAKIATIDIPGLNLLSVDASEEGANFAGAQTSTTTTASGDSYIDFEDGFEPSESDGYLYAFLTNGKLSAGLYSNSEIEGDKRVIRNNGADTISLTSAAWYYELGDKAGQKAASSNEAYPVSDLPCTKIAIAADENADGDIDWNDGALAFRKIMNIPYGSEVIKDTVNYRIVMNFASMASNPYLVTADNIKKVYLATDGLPQAVMLKGYGNEGHDSANSEYADIAEREGGVEDFQELIKIAHDYNTQIGIHVNAQEAYPEAASFNEDMLVQPFSNGWGWLDQSHVINKHWDLASQARWKRFVQLYDRINGTSHYSRTWPDAVEDSKGEVNISKEEIKKEAESLADNMDFIYLDVWYQDAWETRQIAKEINSLGWRFSTEFSAEGEYDSTWQHWSTDAAYGGASSKGYNSDIIRFIRNDQRDSQVLNYPSFGGTADNPLLGGYRLYGFEGWGGDRDFNNYILQTFNQNLPTKFLQHYYVTDWENYEEGQSPVGNHEKQITLKNDDDDIVVVTRNEEQRSDENIERTITLNDRVVLDDVTYLLPWTDEDGTEKLYHWNLDGGTTSWQLPDGWGSAVMYELSDQGRINETTVQADGNGWVTLDAEAATAYVLVKGSSVKTLKNDFGESDYVVDPGFNGYAEGERLSSDEWSGDINDSSVVVEKSFTGDQRLAFNSPSDDVAVTTTISGLKVGADYVAEIYVENDSDAKASIEVNTGNNTVSNYTERSILNNYVKSDQKNGTKMQRMQVSFTAESATAELTLSRAAGEGSTYMDDIRIVEKTLNNVQEDGSFKQDFESVVQGLYPFVLSSAQGISDPVTHLSQLHAPYTQAGWNGRVIDDVLEGNWSVKHHAGANTGIIYQTIPQNYRFEAGKVYTVEFDYQSGPDKAYAMVVGDGTNYKVPTDDQYLAQARGTTQHVTMQVVGSGSGQTWIGLYENGSKAGSGSMGQMDFVLDNLVIKEDKDAVVVTLEKTTLYKGETAKIYGTRLDEVTWESSDEAVAVVDPETMAVKALAAGTTTLTAVLPNGEVKTFEIVVEDDVVVDIPRDELGDMTATANTEETAGEDGGAANAVDGSSSTHWHTKWSGSGFTVGQDNPAVLKVDLGADTTFGGFKFQQRASGPNGIVQQYSYRILDESDNVLTSGGPITVANTTNGAWEMAKFADAVNGRYIEISVEKGNNGFAAIAEVQPIRVQKVTEEATLDNVTLNIGEDRVLEPNHAEGTILKGLVWSSSNEEIVKVNQQGRVTGLKAGEATITVTNAAGLSAECKVTVAKAELDYTELDTQIAKAEEIDLTAYKDDAQKEAFVKALENAKAIREEAVTQQQVDDAAAALADAAGKLNPVETPVELEKDALENAVKDAEKLNLDKYPNGAEKDRFVKALNDAKAALENASSQSMIDAAFDELEAARKALEAIEGADREAPTAPENLKAKDVKENSLVLRWKASKDNVGVAGYEIFVNGVSIGIVKENAALINNLKPGTEYTISVKAFDAAGNYSEAATIKVTTKGKASEKDTTTGTPTVTSVKTGDTAPIIALIVIMVLAAGAIGFVVVRKNSRRSRRTRR